MDIRTFKANFTTGVRPNLFKMEISGFPEKIKFMCKGSQLPGKTIGIIEVPFLNMKHKVAGDVIFDPLSLTIIMDTDLSVRNALESWMETIRNNDAAYGDEGAVYERVGNLIVLGQDGEDLMEYEFVGLWPTNVAPVEMSFDSTDMLAEYTAEFSYTNWNRLK